MPEDPTTSVYSSAVVNDGRLTDFMIYSLVALDTRNARHVKNCRYLDPFLRLHLESVGSLHGALASL
jgi:hypothetical protein